ncbi:MAG TPA: hypothetical protein DDZ83_03115, partial [Nitrospinae bacterium]|nr:hypothetical protein [Nitrospinota bacterium]
MAVHPNPLEPVYAIACHFWEFFSLSQYPCLGAAPRPRRWWKCPCADLPRDHQGLPVGVVPRFVGADIEFPGRKLNAIPGVEAVIEARPSQPILNEVEETGFRRYLEIAKRKKSDFLLFTEIFFKYETFDHEDIITALLLDGSTKKFLKSEMADVELVSADQFLDFPYRDILKTFYAGFSRKITPGLRSAVARRGAAGRG